MALGSVVLPPLSWLVARGEWTSLRHTLRTNVMLVMSVAVPLTIVLILGSRPLIQLLYGRGAFDDADVTRVAHVQALYAIQLPFLAASILGVRLLSTLQAGRTLMAICVCNVSINVVADIVLARWMGVAGIALSTSLVHVVAFGWISWAAGAKLRAVSARVDA
jgi:putative peptidoglycan lipid II flippase